MIFIIREENEQLIFEKVNGRNLLLKAEEINGKILYKLLNPIEPEPIKPMYHHLETCEEFAGKVYINDVDECGTVKRKYILELNEWLESKYNHLAYEEFEGKVYINDVDECGKVKRKYINSQGWFETFHDHFEWNQNLKSELFINDVDGTGKIRAIYIIRVEAWCVANLDHLECEEFPEYVYIKDVDRDGKTKRMYAYDGNYTLKVYTSKQDHLELKIDQCHMIVDVDEYGTKNQLRGEVITERRSSSGHSSLGFAEGFKGCFKKDDNLHMYDTIDW